LSLCVAILSCRRCRRRYKIQHPSKPRPRSPKLRKRLSPLFPIRCIGPLYTCRGTFTLCALHVVRRSRSRRERIRLTRRRLRICMLRWHIRLLTLANIWVVAHGPGSCGRGRVRVVGGHLVPVGRPSARRSLYTGKGAPGIERE